MRDGPGSGLSRAGISAMEAIVALLLGLFILHLGLTTLARLRKAETRLALRSDGLVGMRMARHVLRRELRHGLSGEDWLVDGDSLSLRAFRGTGLVCPSDSTTTEITVSYTGDRRPDPSKDSVLLLDGVGRRTVRALEGVGAAEGSCAGVGQDALERWGLEAPAPPGVVVARLFERGSYHLSESALRYRIGTSGRQPLMPEVWADSSGWDLSGSRLGLEAYPRNEDAGPAWSAFLAWVDTG